jgi:hypothetical protein
MKHSLWRRVAAVAFLLCSCGGSVSGEATEVICDGSTSIRLAYRLMDGRSGAFSGVLNELGWDFLYVDGMCRYWVNEPSTVVDDYRMWRSFRTGTLTGHQEKALRASTSYHNLASEPKCTLTDTVDASTIQLWDGIRSQLCQGSLGVAPDWPMRNELYNGGVSVAGAMRVIVGRQSIPADARTYLWDLAKAPETYLVGYDEALLPGRSGLVVDAKDAEALRAVRNNAIDDALVAPGFFYGVIPIAQTEFVMVMRDHLPFCRPVDGLWDPE